MIATLFALTIVATQPDEPKPPAADRAVVKLEHSTAAKAKAKAEADRKKQERNRLRALNSRRLAGMDGPGPNASRGSSPGGPGNSGGPNPGGSANFGGYSAGSAGYGNFGSTSFGGYGGSGGGSADLGMSSSFEHQLASTFSQAQNAMAAGHAALAATASMT